MNYFWVRVFEYIHERDLYDKGVMLDEFYLKSESLTRENAKRQVKEKYSGQTALELLFAKPKKQTNGIYAIVMDSSRFFYDRFYATLDTYCFWYQCHKPIKGKIGEFPRSFIGEIDDDRDDISNPLIYAHFCSYDCQHQYYKSLKFEGDFQEKEAGQDGNIFGYIYHIYNRASNVHYIGQTRYMPFFRWQEHVKSGLKGDILDLTFDVLTEVRRYYCQSDEENQQYLNSIESWWISKYKEEGYEVINISNPKITIQYLKNRFNEMIAKQRQLDRMEKVL